MIRLAVAAIAILLCFACVSTTGSADQPAMRLDDREYLRSPADSYPGEWPERARERVGAAFDELVSSGSQALAREVGRFLVARQADFQPALLLLAQADFVAGDRGAAASYLKSWAAEVSGYPAATLLWARLAELEADVVEAYEGYRRVAATSVLARRRAAELRSRAAGDLLRRLESAVDSHRVNEARAMLERLERWSPDSVQTLEAAWRVAAVSGEPQVELQSLQRIPVAGQSLQARQRRAELELEIGDAETGLQIYRQLVRDDPDDDGRIEDLAHARFRWRLRLLPDEVLAIADSPQLTRAQFASLLYWLVPGVRNAAVVRGRIATDILDVEARLRQEIVRVVNQGLMDLDASGRRFEPNRSLLQREAWSSVLELLAQREPQPVCVRTLAFSRHSTAERLCETAKACRLLADGAACLAGAPVSGQQAQDLVWRMLGVAVGN